LPKSIVWFRQDLRLADNPALTAAASAGDPVVPVFLWAPEEEGAFPPGGAAKWWQHATLARLQRDLPQLVMRRAPRGSLAALRELVRETGAGRVFWNRRYEPVAQARDSEIKAALRADGLEAKSFNANLLHEPWTIQNKQGRPFQVFTPYYRHCLTLPVPAALPRPEGVRFEAAASETLDALELLPTIPWTAGMSAAWQPGEAGAQAQLDRMLGGGAPAYAAERDRPDHLGTSRLSPHLHFGEMGPRQIWHAVRARYPKGEAEPYLRQLVWRDFAHHLLHHFPHTPAEPLRAEFARFPWRRDERALRAWQRGRTGYPIVDAGMRELWTTGWMHNRVRMIVASFLVKHLRLPWQDGAYWFWDTLVDADLANNTLGWQWSAGCGADAAPYFRVFNPVLQGEKFDPEGAYVRRWVPELAAVPSKWIHQPWSAPPVELAAAGVELGRTYPGPMVDHAEARAGALAAFAELRR